MSEFVTEKVLGSALNDVASALEASTKLLANHASRLTGVEKSVDILSREIDDLFDLTSRLAKVVSKSPAPKNKVVMPVLVGVGIGLYISRKRWMPAAKGVGETLADKVPAKTTAQGKDDQQS